MTMSNQTPIPIRKITVTSYVKSAISDMCRSIYKQERFSTQVVAYAYSDLLMYSVNAFSNSEILPADCDVEDMKSAFISSIPYSTVIPEVDIFLGKIIYVAPSSMKFLMIVRT